MDKAKEDRLINSNKRVLCFNNFMKSFDDVKKSKDSSKLNSARKKSYRAFEDINRLKQESLNDGKPKLVVNKI